MMLYNTGSLEISFSRDEGRLYLKCLAQLSSEEFRRGLTTALHFAEKHHVKHWLLDLREIGSLDDEEEEWLDTNLYPRIMMNLGTNNYVAIVLSEKCYNVLLHEAGRFGLQSYNEFIIINNFYELTEASEWLDNQGLPQVY